MQARVGSGGEAEAGVGDGAAADQNALTLTLPACDRAVRGIYGRKRVEISRVTSTWPGLARGPQPLVPRASRPSRSREKAVDARIKSTAVRFAISLQSRRVDATFWKTSSVMAGLDLIKSAQGDLSITATVLRSRYWRERFGAPFFPRRGERG